MTRIGADVYDGSKWVATYTRGRWYRMQSGDLTPLEPSDPADAGKIVQYEAAKPPVIRRDLQAEYAAARTAELDKLLSKGALERIRRVS